MYFNFCIRKQRKLLKIIIFYGTQGETFTILKNQIHSAFHTVLVKKKPDHEYGVTRECRSESFCTKPMQTNLDSEKPLGGKRGLKTSKLIKLLLLSCLKNIVFKEKM